MSEVTIVDTKVEPTLEEQAAAAGIDVKKIDPTAQSQSADPKPVAPIPDEEDPDLAGVEEEDGEDATDDLSTEDAKEEAEKAAEEAGLDLNEVVSRYYNNGEKLEESDYKALEDANYPRALVDQFIEGRKAVVEMQRQTVFSNVGGEAKYTAVTKWAADTLSEKEIATYNAAVNSNNMDEVLMAVKGLQARYESGRSVSPQRKVTGRTTATPSVYTSISDLKADMANPRYSKDPVFRSKVEAKLARSNIL